MRKTRLGLVWLLFVMAFIGAFAFLNKSNHAYAAPAQCFWVDLGGNITENTLDDCDYLGADDGLRGTWESQFQRLSVSERSNIGIPATLNAFLNETMDRQPNQDKLPDNTCWVTRFEYTLSGPLPNYVIAAGMVGELPCDDIAGSNVLTDSPTVLAIAAANGVDPSEIVIIRDENNNSTTESTAIDDNLDCIAASELLFRWIVCPVVEFTFEVIDLVYDGLILQLLVVDPLDQNADDTTPEAAVYRIWNNFRVIANIGFVIVFLLAIFGQSFNFIFTSYELKKIIPRLALGFIAVQLSWYICGFMVDLSNILGSGVRSLVLTPVRSLSLEANLNFESAWQEIGSQLGLIGAGVAIWYVGGFLSGLPMILFPIIMGLVSVMIVLLLRKALILVLIVASPIAFVAGILPNTTEILKKWWSIFSKALMMYPLVVLLLAAGELFARITTAGNTENGVAQDPLVSIVGIIAFFAPFFLIPLTFNYAGSAISAVSGGMSDFGKNMNNRVFGDIRDPGSYRGRRRGRQVVGQRRKKYRAINASYGDSKASKMLRPLGYGLTRFGPGMSDQFGASMEEADKRVEDIVNNGRDEVVYAVLGNKHIFGGNDLTPDAIQSAKQFRNDPFMQQAALNYAIRKAGSSQELETTYNNWMNGGHKPGDFGARLSKSEKAATFARGAEKHKGDHGDLPFRDPNNGFKVTNDIGKQTRMLSEANNQKTSYNFSKQRQSYWQGLNEVNSNARNVHQQVEAEAASRGTTAQQLYNTPEFSQQAGLVKEMQTLRNGLSERMASGAPISAEGEHNAFMEDANTGWLRGVHL